MSLYSNPAQQETSLIGQWVLSNGKVIADDVCQRIEYLIDKIFVRVATDSSGWFTLYKDPLDGRYWELSYPYSDQSGGGAPSLKVLEWNDAMKKYCLSR
jgi:hypothetical protein